METSEEIFQKIIEACEKLDWVFAVNAEDNGNVSGLIIGTIDYVTEITDQLEDPEDFPICAARTEKKEYH